MPFAPASVTAASARRGGGADQNGGAEEVGEAHRCELLARRASASSSCTPSVPSTTMSASLGDLRGPLVGADADADARRELALARRARRSARKASRSVASSPTYSAASTSVSARNDSIPAPLSIRTGGRTSSTLRPQCVRRPAASARAAMASIAARAASSSGAPRQWKATIGPLSSSRTRGAAQVGGVGLAAELVDPPRPILERRVDHRLGPAGAQQLGAVRAEVGDRADRHHRPRLGGAPAAHAGDDAGSAGRRSISSCRVASGTLGVGRVLDDRRQRAVDVEQDRGPRRVRREAARAPLDKSADVTTRSMPAATRSTVGIGLPAMTDTRGYAVSNLDRDRRGLGFRKIRHELGITAFGINAIVLPPGYETGMHFHDEQEETYFVHAGRIEFRFGDGSRHVLGDRRHGARLAGHAPRDGEHRRRGCGRRHRGGKDGYVGRDGQAGGCDRVAADRPALLDGSCRVSGPGSAAPRPARVRTRLGTRRRCARRAGRADGDRPPGMGWRIGADESRRQRAGGSQRP